MGRLSLVLRAIALASAVNGQSLPYSPSRILLAPNASTAYIIQPSRQYTGQARLQSLDLRQPFSASTNPFTTLYETLPFLDDAQLRPYTPVIDGSGNITVVTGNCSDGAEGTLVYHFRPQKDGNGTWAQYETTQQGLGSSGTQGGTNFLSAGVSFSEYTNGNTSNTNVFIFGGMCPFANSTTETWTGNADYSNLMLTMTPQTNDASHTDYEISLASSRGPPIAEAGFTITGLPATYSSRSTSDAQNQQQDFVLLGGHTQAAFINMSQVALFSLPQESWTFLPVAQPSDASAIQVEPRSGHTAVLSEDGSSVIVFGGWVGDVSTPAQPQLAVLDIGSGYGGTGGWSWSIPPQSDGGLTTGSGIFGHGVSMLPGGVMMIVGGYSISASISSRVRRGAQQLNNQIMLYNTSSNSWITSYAAPSDYAETEKSSGALTKSSQKAGLGVGLALAIILFAGLIIFYIYYTRKMKQEREQRARALLASSSDGSFNQPFLEKGSIDGRGGEMSAASDYWQSSTRPMSETLPWPQQQMHPSSATTGLFTDVPSPTRGLRKGVSTRNYQYHAAPRYDEKRISRGSGNIHTIAEHENEDAIERLPYVSDDLSLAEVQRQLRDAKRVVASNPRVSRDPFRDPEPNPLGSHPVSPEMSDTVRRVPTGASRAPSPPRRRVPGDYDSIPNWTAEYPIHEPLLNEHGRISPSKSDERTSSTLSERSQRSTNSSSSITRTMSTRTGALLAAAMSSARTSHSHSPERLSPSDERSNPMNAHGTRKLPYILTGRARASTADSISGGAPHSASTDADSFTTAKTNFVALQSEGEAMLGGRPPVDPDDPYQRAMAAHNCAQARTPSASYDGLVSTLPTRKRPGLLGSLRRAIGAISTGERSFSLTGARENYTDERSSSSSPTKDRRQPIGSTPRRAVSDGGTLLRQKRGRKDWESANNAWPPYRDEPDWGEPRSSTDKRQAEEDWDVEDAVTSRDVQIMFTVPKSRLRVVNDDMDRASLRSASDSGMLSRSGSVRTVRKEDSVKALKTLFDHDRAVLAATVEEGEDADAVDGAESGTGKAKAA